MKIKDYYDLTKVKQIETETPIGKSYLIVFEDGNSIELHEGHYIQLLSFLETEQETLSVVAEN